MDKKREIIIIGAGPAGLSAGLSLLKTTDFKPIIIEQEDSIGGISKTFCNNGFYTDIGPHRFFTKDERVFNLWTDLLPLQGMPAADDKLFGREIKEGDADPETQDDVFLSRKRFSRIYYRKHFIDYPIKIKPQTFVAIGAVKTVLSVFSYLKSCFFKLDETNLEAFMINKFGRVLYECFFEGYTEKVWGVHPSEISKEWGEQRIQSISLIRIIIDAILSILPLKRAKETSLIDKYYYPKFGCSQMWNKIAGEIKELGGEIILNTKVSELVLDNNKIVNIKIINEITNEEKILTADKVISTMPIKELITNMKEAPADIRQIASDLQYRDFILVNFVTNNLNLKNNTKYKTVNNIAPDSWIYLQDSDIIASRLDIMNNFSPYLVKDYKKEISLNLEYYCNENDEFWSKSDDEIIEFAGRELLKLNALQRDNIICSKVFRIKKAYPSYFGSYEHFDKIKDFINSIENLYPIGRNGQHKYNNMDHSMLSGIVVAEILKENSDKTAVWDINLNQTYQE